MASVRMALMDALVARLATIEGWTARLRDIENPEGNAPVVATVYFVDEDKRFANDQSYGCTLQVGVEIVARAEDAHSTIDGRNAFRYLDRQVVLLEQQIHAPDAWGSAPLFSEIVVNGHSVDSVDGDVTSLVAYVLLTITYRHHFQNPEVAV